MRASRALASRTAATPGPRASPPEPPMRGHFTICAQCGPAGLPAPPPFVLAPAPSVPHSTERSDRRVYRGDDPVWRDPLRDPHAPVRVGLRVLLRKTGGETTRSPRRSRPGPAGRVRHLREPVTRPG